MNVELNQWEQDVWSRILLLDQQTFTRQEFLERYLSELNALYPSAKTPGQTISRTLQDLRNKGLLEPFGLGYQNQGVYTISSKHFSPQLNNLLKTINELGSSAEWSEIYDKTKGTKKAIRDAVYKAVKLGILVEVGTGNFVTADQIENTNRQPTERNTLTKVRATQGQFRTNLLSDLENICPITETKGAKFLEASHIKPWSRCSESERQDSSNGLLLTASMHKLFDIGLISFTSTKELLISDEISTENRHNLGLGLAGRKVNKLPVIGREKYLKWHKQNLFG